jgi:hypothetical protein
VNAIRHNPFLRFEATWYARSQGARALANLYPAVITLAFITVFLFWKPPTLATAAGDRHWGGLFMAALLVSQGFLLAMFAPIEGLSRGWREKGAGKLDLLITSPVAPNTVFVGLLDGACVPLIYLVATTLPLAVLAVALGQVLPVPVIVGYAVLLFQGAAMASLGLVASLTFTTTGAAWTLCFGSSIALALFGPGLDFLVTTRNSSGLVVLRVCAAILLTVPPVLWAFLCALRGRWVVRGTALVAFLLLTGSCGVIVGLSGAEPGRAVLSALSMPAVVAGKSFGRFTGMSMIEEAWVLNLFYSAGLALLFSTAAYLKIEKTLDRRPFHEL